MTTTETTPAPADRPHARGLALAAAAALAVGLLAGYLLFGGGGTHAHDDPHADPAPTGEAAAHDHAGETVYTCSMHPQIRRDGPGECPICGMDLVPLGDVATDDDPAVLTMTPAAVAMARVQTTRVRPLGSADDAAGTDDVGGASHRTAVVTLTGTLAADEDGAAVLASDVAGRVEDLAVAVVGQTVRRGQRYATLYAPELVAAQRELVAATRLGAGNPQLVEALRTRLRSLRVPAELIAEVERTGEPRERIPLYAGAGGTVLAKLVEVGDYVAAGAPLFRLNDLGRVAAEFEAFERDLAHVALGDRIAFTTPAAPGETFSARVSFVDPVIDPTTRTATVRAEVPNPRGRLKPGMLVTGTLAATPAAAPDDDEAAGGGEPGGPVVVPATAVLWTGERSVVYVERPDAPVPSYEFREVTTAGRAGDDYVVNEGLRAGERVVTRGAFSIDAAAQLNNQYSMMNRDVVLAGRGGATYVAVPDFSDAAPAAFRERLRVLVAAYLPLKDALVASDLAAVGDAMAGFRLRLREVGGPPTDGDADLLAGDAHDYWASRREALAAHAEALAGTEDLAAVREQFAYLSEALVDAARAFGLAGGGPVYVEHCPMALDNQGADWLSEQPVIRNPYFGDAMLTCGSVVDTLR